jgi:hypothetical protein
MRDIDFLAGPRHRSIVSTTINTMDDLSEEVIRLPLRAGNISQTIMKPKCQESFF